MKDMRIFHVVPDLSEEANGVAPVIAGLMESAIGSGNDVALACLGVKHPVDGAKLFLGKKWPVLKRFEISFELVGHLADGASEYDIVHNHSLWSMINVAAGVVALGKKAKFVCSPHGTLSTWALNRSRLVKKILWPIQRLAILNADLVHATSMDEYHDIRRVGFSGPIAVVPNGMAVPNIGSASPARSKTVLFLSRIHPKKGIENLLNSWKEIEEDFKDWRLVVAGKGEDSYVDEVKRLASDLELQRVNFPGPLYGHDKERAYQQSSLFILPTYSENFGMVVAEALVNGCPAIVGKGAPWSGLVDHACGWWVSNDEGTLTKTLRAALALEDNELAAMGERGRRWIIEDFSWPVVGGQMVKAYEWLLKGGNKPEWVLT